jgi:hypothetical protein
MYKSKNYPKFEICSIQNLFKFKILFNWKFVQIQSMQIRNGSNSNLFNTWNLLKLRLLRFGI